MLSTIIQTILFLIFKHSTSRFPTQQNIQSFVISNQTRNSRPCFYPNTYVFQLPSICPYADFQILRALEIVKYPWTRRQFTGPEDKRIAGNTRGKANAKTSLPLSFSIPLFSRGARARVKAAPAELTYPSPDRDVSTGGAQAE